MQWRTVDFSQVPKIYISRYPPTPLVKSEFKHSITFIFKCFWFFLTNKDTKNKIIYTNIHPSSQFT